MLAATVAALVWANVGPGSYESFQTFQLGPLDLEHWSADGLLTIFFFVAGLELKRELTIGSLAKPADALVPVVAALCGMVVPALIYLIVNLSAAGGRPEGWAVPIATDIAFALAILALVGRHLPSGLRAFLLTLAIVDDLGAILVIAALFTESVHFLWLSGAAVCILAWLVLQRLGIDRWWIFLPLGVAAWICMLQSGVHATITGVVLGLATRSVERRSPDRGPPVDRWEHIWRPVSAGVAVPFFALLAAGISVDPGALAVMLHEPLAIGVLLGLIVGKTLGIFGGAFLTTRLTRAELAPDLRWLEVFSISLVAGVGFTVALLVSDLAFGMDSAAAQHSKTAVLIGSVVAALLAAVSLSRRNRSRRRLAAGRLT